MTCEASATRRYLALFLPWLSAERAIRMSAAPPDAAFALVDNVAGAMRVAAVSPAAARLGLVGLTLADARAREPGLLVINHDPAADAALLDWLADGCERYSPTVALDPPFGIVIDITGRNTEFDSENALAADVRTRFGHHRMTIVSAVASTADAAAALARFDCGETIATLPVAALRVDPAVHLALRRAGLTTIGALAALPRASLAARFGERAPTLLARLLGGEDAPLIPRRHPPDIVIEHRFADPVAVTATVLRTLDRLMRQAAATLEQRSAGGRRFEAALFRSDGHVARLVIDTAVPTRDPKILARLIAERIETLADPLDPGFGYDIIRFAVPRTEPLAAVQLGLDGGSVAEEQVAALVDRLTTRLGADRVRRLARGDSHIPEQTSFDLPAATAPQRPWPTAEAGEPPRRPLHLFARPHRIEVLAEVPDGPPRWFSWRQCRHEIARSEGPERIAAEWWRRRNGGGATRDYYRIEDTHGRRFWVFRHGLYGIEKPHPDWYLHGVFA